MQVWMISDRCPVYPDQGKSVVTSETSRDWVSVLAGNSPRFWREFSPGKFTKNVARFVCVIFIFNYVF